MTSPAGMETRCRSCGKKIAFGRLGNGKLIPLDLVAPVYSLHDDGDAHRADSLYVSGISSKIVGFYVSHFCTCPSADQHRKPKKVSDGQQERVRATSEAEGDRSQQGEATAEPREEEEGPRS